jgi:acetyl esterase/lipase
MYAYNAHIQFLINGYKLMKTNGQDVSIVIVNYGISPEAPYPSQIRHMVATVQHLLSTRSPGSVS